MRIRGNNSHRAMAVGRLGFRDPYKGQDVEARRPDHAGSVFLGTSSGKVFDQTVGEGEELDPDVPTSRGAEAVGSDARGR
jgi:hypothetical protein